MGGRQNRERQRAAARRLKRLSNFLPKKKCPKCGKELTYGMGHFVGPSLGEEGFFICDTSRD